MPEGIGSPGHSPMGPAHLGQVWSPQPQAAVPTHCTNPFHDHFSHEAACFDQTALHQHAHHFADASGHHGHAGQLDLAAQLKCALEEIALLKQNAAHPASETTSSKKESAAEKEMQQLEKDHKASMERMERKAEMQAEIGALQAKIKMEKQAREFAIQNI